MIPKCLFTEELLVIWHWLLHGSEACLSCGKGPPEVSLHRNELCFFPPECFNVQGLVRMMQFHMENGMDNVYFSYSIPALPFFFQFCPDS